MITLNKNKDKDFVILNLSDFQLWASEWEPTSESAPKIRGTIDELYKRAKPDLVTITGDLAWSGDFDSLRGLAKVLESYEVPWTYVFGNHDQEDGLDALLKTVDFLAGYEHCIFEKGPYELGAGNFVINIKEDDKIVHSMILMDTHNRLPLEREDGQVSMEWGKLIPEQLEWYKEQIKELKKLGSPESSLFTHIPIYAYNKAWEAAHNKEYNQNSIMPWESSDPKYWNEGYKDSFGVRWEGICSYPRDEGAFEVIKEMDHTKNLFCGHDHVNNFSVKYEGVRFTFVLKTTHGAYYKPELNGGTVMTVNQKGEMTVKHEYVDLYMQK